MLSKKKKIIIIVAMVLLLAVTSYLNIALNNKSVDTSNNNVSTSNFFASYRDDRTQNRNQEILVLEAIIADANSTEDAKNVAEAKRVELVALMEKELLTEGLIKSKGFEDCIVAATSNSVNVVVKSANLEANEVAQIAEIIMENTNVSIDNIKIIPVE